MKNAEFIELPGETAQEVRVRLTGELVLGNSVEICRRLVELLQQRQKLIIQLGEISNLDLSVIQVLYSLDNAARQAGKVVLIESALKPELSALIRNAGFDRVFKLS